MRREDQVPAPEEDADAALRSNEEAFGEVSTVAEPEQSAGQAGYKIKTEKAATTKPTAESAKAPPRLLSLADMGISTAQDELIVFSLRRAPPGLDSPLCFLLGYAMYTSLLVFAWAWLPDRWRWLPDRWEWVPERWWWLPAPRTRHRALNKGRCAWSRTARKCWLEGGGPRRREVLSAACALLLGLAGCAWLPVAAAAASFPPPPPSPPSPPPLPPLTPGWQHISSSGPRRFPSARRILPGGDPVVLRPANCSTAADCTAAQSVLLPRPAQVETAGRPALCWPRTAPSRGGCAMQARVCCCRRLSCDAETSRPKHLVRFNSRRAPLFQVAARLHSLM
jgi:hypothetical protein